MASSKNGILFRPPSSAPPSKTPISSKPTTLSSTPTPTLFLCNTHIYPFLKRRDFRVFFDDGDADGGGGDYEMDDEEIEEVDNKKDFDVEYRPLGIRGEDEVIQVVQNKRFVSS
ncbi:unnamed protein product [Amaranthus hypochondriacus]